MKDSFDVGFAMGLLAGEGSFTHDNKAPEITMNLHRGDRAPLEKVKSVFGGKIYPNLTCRNEYSHGRGPYSKYVLIGKDMMKAIPIIDTYLPPCNKRAQFEAWRLKHKI